MASAEQHRELFRALDTDGTRSLTLDEITKKFETHGVTDSELIKKYFNRVDSSKDGKITEEEFLKEFSVSPDTRIAPDTKKATMRRAFREFDTDGSGHIDKRELKEVVGHQHRELSDAQLDRLIARIDVGKDGRVGYEDFIKHFYNE